MPNGEHRELSINRWDGQWIHFQALRTGGFQVFASRNKSTVRNILEITTALLYTAKQPICIWEGTFT
jgi:hypothetical protein